MMQSTLLANPGDWANTALNLALCLLLVVLPVQVGWRHHAAAVARRHQAAVELTRAVDQTRRKLAEQMHDVVAYQVSLIALRASMLDGREDAATLRRESDTISQMAVAALEELRDIIHDLRAPDTATPGTTSDRLREAVATFAEIHRVDLRIRGAADGLAEHLAQLAVNVVREGLVNASKYAPESDIDVSVVVADGRLRVLVRNSSGNRHNGVLPPGSGTGLANLRNQVDALGGVIEHAPMSGGGFQLAVTVPLESGMARTYVASGESCNLG
jgi:signal transduction histidine kinase